MIDKLNPHRLVGIYISGFYLVLFTVITIATITAIAIAGVGSLRL